MKLHTLQFSVCKSDAGVYVKSEKDGSKSYILVYVDDLLIASKQRNEIVQTKGALLEDFKIHDLGEVKDFLGCQVKRDRGSRQLSVSCIPKIDALVEKFGL